MSLSRVSGQLERIAINVHRSVTHYTTKRRTEVTPDIRRWLTTTHTRLSYRSAPHTSLTGDVSRASSNKLTAIHSHVTQVLNSLPEHVPEKAPLLPDEALRVLGTLATAARPQDLALIENILGQLTPLCGLLKNGNLQTLLNWLSHMHDKPGNVRPFLEHWHAFLSHCADNGQPKVIRHAMSKMAHTGRKPNNDTFRILFRALFNSGAPVGEFYSAFDRIENYAFRYDESLAEMLFEGFMKLNEPHQASQVKEEFQKRFGKRVVKSTAIQAEWEESLENEVEKCGIASGVRLCEDFRKEGYKVTSHTLTIMLRSSRQVADLDYAEDALQMKAGPLQWSILISNAVHAGDLTGAHSIYSQFKSRGLMPDAPLIQPLSFIEDSPMPIRRRLPMRSRHGILVVSAHSDRMLTCTGLSSVPWQTRSTFKSTPNSPLDSSQTWKRERSNPMATSPSPPSSSWESAAPPTSTTPSRRTAKSWATKTPKTSASKGTGGSSTVLSRLSFDHGPAVPSIWHYFEIVKDMRRSGVEITPYVYASLLRRLAKLAEDASDEDTRRLAVAVRRVHDHLTLDPSITPDTLLWNQLMDAYQRVGLFVEAYRIWEVLLISETYDHASVSIILDACGYANAWPLAEQVIKKLSGRSFSLNQGNWNAYVECMCRVGMLNDAVKMVCLEMGKNQKDVKPNLVTAQVLLTFATKTNQQDEVAMRLRRYLPTLWESLPPDLDGFVIKPEGT
ncbi:hypothetical protein JVU11DRAFT_4834 [Chiua virens]|nr:hypothetical protein JVU11DRAFT_4834 [Chiua virens]